jgi:hypothetical protein
MAQPAPGATNGATLTTAASGRDMTQVKKGYLDPQVAFEQTMLSIAPSNVPNCILRALVSVTI